MADVQVENGFIRIATDLLEALAKQPLPPNTMSVFLTIIRKTYGFNKTKDDISLSQFCIATGMKRPEVCRSLNRLAKMTMIGRTANAGVTTYWIIKDFDRWTLLAKQPQGVAKQPMSVGRTANASLAKQPHTIDNSTKDNITKDITYVRRAKARPKQPPDPELGELRTFFIETFKEKFTDPYAYTYGKDDSILKGILKTFGLEKAKEKISAFFSDESEFLKRSGYSVGVFKSQVNKYQTGKRKLEEWEII
jgi:phage replication O-like protein O